MNFNLTRPCDNCPFRSDVVPYIEPERALQIACDLERETFQCHKTVYAKQPRDSQGRYAKRELSHCAGALIIMAKMDWFGDMQQLAERFGMYDPANLDTSAPVYDSFTEWVRAHGIENARLLRRHRNYSLTHLKELIDER